jgi:hypothetical protein
MNRLRWAAPKGKKKLLQSFGCETHWNCPSDRKIMEGNIKTLERESEDRRRMEVARDRAHWETNY